MLKFCMPTFGNGRNNSKTACICFYRVPCPKYQIGLSRSVYVGAIFSAVATCRGFHLTVIAWRRSWHCCIYNRLFPWPLSSHATECSGIVGEGTSVCRFKSVPTSVIADQLAHARQTRVSGQSIPCFFDV